MLAYAFYIQQIHYPLVLHMQFTDYIIVFSYFSLCHDLSSVLFYELPLLFGKYWWVLLMRHGLTAHCMALLGEHYFCIPVFLVCRECYDSSDSASVFKTEFQVQNLAYWSNFSQMSDHSKVHSFLNMDQSAVTESVWQGRERPHCITCWRLGEGFRLAVCAHKSGAHYEKLQKGHSEGTGNVITFFEPPDDCGL